MYADSRNTGLQVYRAARELARRKAIKRQEIRAQNPEIAADMLERVVEAQIAHEDARAEAERSKGRKGKGRSNKGPRKSPPNNTLRQKVSRWKQTAEERGVEIHTYRGRTK